MRADVAVVGASPAGIMAASSASRAGAATVLIDQDLSGVHPANTVFEGMAGRAGIDFRRFATHTLDGMRIVSPSGYAVEIAARGYFLNRRDLDSYLLKEARELGVETVEMEAIGVARSGRRTVLETSCGPIEAGVVIDAGGVDSRIARIAGLNSIRHPEDIAWALEAEVELPWLGEEPLFEYWIGSISPGWKATFSPGGGARATLGVFVRGKGRDISQFLGRFLRAFKNNRESSYPNIEEMKVMDLRRGGDPIAALPGDLVSDGLMVTGGAAAQSGLAYSMMAGRICGDVAARAITEGDTSKRSLSRYEKLWWSEMGREYRMARASLATLQSLRDGEIDRLVQALSGKDLLVTGSFYKKSISAGLAVGTAMPKALMMLMRNWTRG